MNLQFLVRNGVGCYVCIQDITGFKDNEQGFEPKCGDGFVVPTVLTIPQEMRNFRVKDVDFYTFLRKNDLNIKTPHIVNSIVRHYEDGPYDEIVNGQVIHTDRPYTKCYTNLVKPVEMRLTVDGWYSIVNMAVPTSDWLLPGIIDWIVPSEDNFTPLPADTTDEIYTVTGYYFEKRNGRIFYTRKVLKTKNGLSDVTIYDMLPLEGLRFSFKPIVSGQNESVLKLYTNNYVNDIMFADAKWESIINPPQGDSCSCNHHKFINNIEAYGESGNYDAIRSGIFYSEKTNDYHVNYLWAEPQYQHTGKSRPAVNATPLYWVLHEKRLNDCEMIIYKNLDNTTMSRTQKEFISLCNLTDCWLGLSKQLMDKMGPCMGQWDENKQLRYRRDVVKMSLDVIRYMTEQVCNNDYSEIQKTIESLAYCGLCTGIDLPKTRQCNCNG